MQLFHLQSVSCLILPSAPFSPSVCQRRRPRSPPSRHPTTSSFSCLLYVFPSHLTLILSEQRRKYFVVVFSQWMWVVVGVVVCAMLCPCLCTCNSSPNDIHIPPKYELMIVVYPNLTPLTGPSVCSLRPPPSPFTCICFPVKRPKSSCIRSYW